MNKKQELKPCPFCGEKAIMQALFTDPPIYFVICSKCLKGRERMHFSEYAAIKDWNNWTLRKKYDD